MKGGVDRWLAGECRRGQVVGACIFFFFFSFFFFKENGMFSFELQDPV